MDGEAMDVYDEAVAYWQEHFSPEAITHSWTRPDIRPGGALFLNCDYKPYEGFTCGCLTQVKSGHYVAATAELTEAIRADPRLPDSPENITLESLPAFAEWQRRIDKALGRTVTVDLSGHIVS
jgi:hypothetical protein